MRGLLRLPLRLRFYRRRPDALDWAFGVWMVFLVPLVVAKLTGSFDWTLLAIFDALFLPSLFVGARLVGGYRKRYAFTTTKGHSVRILETATLEDSSSFHLHGLVSVDGRAPTWLRLASSYSERGLSIGGTETRGVSGEPLGRVV